MNEVTTAPEARQTPWQRQEAAIAAMAERIRAMDDTNRGDLAALRRMTPDRLDRAAFWKLLAAVAPQDLENARRHEPWAMIAAGMAVMAPRHHSEKMPLGRVLAQSGFQEGRLEQFLRARGEHVWPSLRRMCAFLANRENPAFDWRPLGRLLLTGNDDIAEDLRRRIARDFYATHQRQEHERETQ